MYAMQSAQGRSAVRGFMGGVSAPDVVHVNPCGSGNSQAMKVMGEHGAGKERGSGSGSTGKAGDASKSTGKGSTNTDAGKVKGTGTGGSKFQHAI